MENNQQTLIEQLYNNGCRGEVKANLDTDDNLVVKKRIPCVYCGAYLVPKSMSRHRKTAKCHVNTINPLTRIEANRMSYHDMKRSYCSRY